MVDFVGSYGFDFTRNSYYRPAIDPVTDAILSFVSPDVTFDTYSLFGQAEFDFGRLKLVGGARQEWYRGEIGERRSEEHTSELQSLMRISYAIFCLKNKIHTCMRQK